MPARWAQNAGESLLTKVAIVEENATLRHLHICEKLHIHCRTGASAKFLRSNPAVAR